MNEATDAPVKDIPLSKVWELYQVLKHRLSKDVYGRDSDWDKELYPEGGLGTLQMIITAILSGGHVLLEDYPGSGKSFLVVKLSQCIHDDIPEKAFDIPAFKRIQCVPDLLPSDIMGYNKPAFNSEPAMFVHGPLFTYFLLLDEINRTTPKVQSAMLEAMAEGRVTVEGKPKELGKLFFVIATQNPLDKVGTYPLPSASLDRFLFKRTLEPISEEATVRIIVESGERGGDAFERWRAAQKKHTPGDKAKKAEANPWADRVVNATELIAAKQALKRKVSLSNATINALLNVDRLIHQCYTTPIDSPSVKETPIFFKEGSRPSPRTLQRLAGALKVMALICTGEELEAKGVSPAGIQAELDKAPLETNPRLLRKIVADFLRHRVHPTRDPAKPKDLDRYLVAIAERAIAETLESA